MKRLLVVAALLAAATGAPGAAEAQIDFIPFRPLEPGPGAGFRSSAEPMVRALHAGVTFHPILTVGDTLVSDEADLLPYVFYPLPHGIVARQAGSGLVEVFVTHELGWEDGLGGARISRFLLDQRSAGVVAADYVLDGHEEFRRLGSATMAGSHDGFLSPNVLIGEESIDGPRRGVAAAIDARNGTLTTLPWLGRFPRGVTLVVPVSSGRVAAISLENDDVAGSRLWLYLADSDSDFLAGRGQLYVFRADAPSFGENTRLASMATKTRPLTGRFVPLDPPLGYPLANQPSLLQGAAQSIGSLTFVRLADAALDDERLDSFYLVDAGDPSWADPLTGQPVTANGRLYHVSLDPQDPTRVRELAVVLDGDGSDDLFRPSEVATRENVVMIQENPGVRGIRPSRILRYDTRSRLLEPLAVCVERDPQGRLLPEGTGGAWTSTGIVDVSDFFGDDAWLIAVQAPTMRTSPFRTRGGSGQLLLLRGPDAAPPERPKRKDKGRDDSKREQEDARRESDSGR